MPIYHHSNRQKIIPPPSLQLVTNWTSVDTTNVDWTFTQDGNSMRLRNTGNYNTNASSPTYSRNINFRSTYSNYSTGQTITAKMKFNTLANGEQVGFGLRNSANGFKLVFLAGTYFGGLRRVGFTGANGVSQLLGDTTFSLGQGSSFWLKMQDDGTNINFWHSQDGTNFTLISRSKAGYGVNYPFDQMCLTMVPFYNTSTGDRTDFSYESFAV